MCACALNGRVLLRARLRPRAHQLALRALVRAHASTSDCVNQSVTEEKIRLQQIMEVLSYILIALVIVLLVFLGVMIHSGVFYRLSIRTAVPRAIPSRVAYKVYRGPYTNAGAGFEDIMRRAPGYTRMFGVYYDDPKQVAVSGSPNM